MKLSDLLQRIKIAVPNMNETGVENTYLTELFNQACNDFLLLTKVWVTSTDFNIVAEQQEYELSTIVPTYLGTAKEGLFFLNSSSKWKDIIPKTKAWISEMYPDFLNATSTAVPKWYYTEGDTLGFHPKPSTDQTEGGKLFHLKKSVNMSGNDDFPFSGDASKEITAFIPADDALIAYVRWKLSPAFGQVTDQDVREREYLNECRKAAKQIKRRRDLTHDSDYRLTLWSRHF